MLLLYLTGVVLDRLTKEQIIDLACKSEREVSNPKILATLSDCIGSKWKSFAQNLNLIDTNEIEIIERDNYDYGCKEMCVQMLHVWVKQRMCTTTVGDLAKAMKFYSNPPAMWIAALRSVMELEIGV